MKYTPSTGELVRWMLEDEYASWSPQGARALIEWIDEIEPDTEFDLVAMRCNYHEYKTASEAVEDKTGEELPEDEAMKLLEDEGVLATSGDFGVIVINN